MIRKVCFFGPKKMRFMQTESVLRTKNRSGPAKNRFSVALITLNSRRHDLTSIEHYVDHPTICLSVMLLNDNIT